MKTTTELPNTTDWPHTTCRLCDRSLINGLFTPAELKSPVGPRCRSCIGDVNVGYRHSTRGLPTPTARELKASAGWQDYKERTQP